MSCAEDEIVVPASGAIQSQRVSFAGFIQSSAARASRITGIRVFNESIRTVVEWFDLLT
jgi:hypothetical protein